MSPLPFIEVCMSQQFDVSRILVKSEWALLIDNLVKMYETPVLLKEVTIFAALRFHEFFSNCHYSPYLYQNLVF